jgi:arginine-tRNA-protein transferase
MTRQQSTDLPAWLRFYATLPRTCSYLEQRQAVSVFADPSAVLDTSIYDRLAVAGFRRSGNDLYRPACPGCSACIPLRVPVDYVRSRKQQRAWKLNQDLDCTILPADFRKDHYELYKTYLEARHPDGGMADTDQNQYMEFLTSYWSETRFIEFRLDQKLVAVAVTDYLNNALSAVYTFFSAEHSRRSLGTYSILYQLELAKQLGFSWVYLGYWIDACTKMGYKADFQPCEIFQDGQWQLLNKNL